jgi:cyclic pyranopterin monophosphate synthase
MTERLTHLDDEGNARMVDVSAKAVTQREATATATVRMSPDTARLLGEGGLPKGDALAVARVAGIMGAKQTPALIPLCHPIAVTSVDIDITVDVGAGTATVTAVVATRERTGVEMEALVAAGVAAFTLYDMIKGVERGAAVENVQVVAKSGGRSGTWTRDA